MALAESDIDLISRQLDSSLSEEEERLFESRKNSSEEFVEELLFQRRVLGQIQAQEKSKRKAIMLQDFREIREETKKTRVFLKRPILYLVAAVFVLLATFHFVLEKPRSSGEVFSTYFQVYDGAVTTRGDDNSISTALTSYNAGNFSKALEILIDSKEFGIPQNQVNLLLISCYLALEQPNEAMKLLKVIQEPEQNSIAQNRDWYLALTLIKLDRISEAKEVLLSIKSSQHVYTLLAARLLEEDLFN